MTKHELVMINRRTKSEKVLMTGDLVALILEKRNFRTNKNRKYILRPEIKKVQRK